jgi:hypothetical protein
LKRRRGKATRKKRKEGGGDEGRLDKGREENNYFPRDQRMREEPKRSSQLPLEKKSDHSRSMTRLID